MSMTEEVTSKTYDLWSRFYDRTFGTLVRQRQVRTVEQLKLHLRPGDRVLDIGVGTGLTLPLYPHNVQIVGMDLSAGMLNKAADRRDELNLSHCRLVRGDAMLPPFAPASFDHVVMCHTISVVSDPVRLLRWTSALIKPGGSILVLNHFQSMHRWIAALEKIFNPLCKKIGWRTDLNLEELSAESGMNIDYIFKVSYLDVWQIVLLSQRQPNSAATRPAVTPPQPAATPTPAPGVRAALAR